ncbi:GNAT family acetyltransferase YjcF [hydrothermal vent metagenome]|uniref:GNAT family acetyltransferase YjcF n=1 Tax=hydrothermal vent metagenome TaxID=652676 RepID=A0A3B0WI18_9ZZZZ
MLAQSSLKNNMPNDDIKIREVNWSTDKESLSKIRSDVFIDEQNVPEKLEWDEFDNTSLHFLVTKNNKTIACARLKSDGQIGRMAVLKKYRNQGIGKKLLQFVLQKADSKKLKNIYLHAQISAIPFYENQGFTTSDDIFFEADIPHKIMQKTS